MSEEPESPINGCGFVVACLIVLVGVLGLFALVVYLVAKVFF
jgi:hypothetical protein